MLMERILVTGGAGFIGSHLCKRLLSEGKKVYCLDNFFTGSKKNISEFMNCSNFMLIEQEVEQELDIDVDKIYNLACPASPPYYQYDPVKTVKTSVLGIINMLELARKNNARILQASTSEVYGDPTQHPQRETYWGNVNPIGIRSCYDEGKRCAETIMMDYHRRYGVDVKIVRIFNTYGPNMDPRDGRVVSNFIVQALLGKNITVYGEGAQTRSFCYIDDLVEGIVRMMELDNFTGPVNLGNPSERMILDLADLVIKMTNSKSKIIFKSLPSDDPVKRRPDISLAKQNLGWEPKISIEEGLEKTIEYFKNTDLTLRFENKNNLV